MAGKETTVEAGSVTRELAAIERKLMTIRNERLALERRLLDGGDPPNVRSESARNLMHT